MRDINRIVIHHTDMAWGDVEDYRRIAVHDQGHSDISYHYLILNPYPAYFMLANKKPSVRHDGVICAGRPLDVIGAHARGANKDSIGIALVGIDNFTPAQMKSLRSLVQSLQDQYGGNLRVVGHKDVGKTDCPGVHIPPGAVERWWLEGLDTFPTG